MITQRSILFIGLLALPAAAFALDFSNTTSTYTDAPFSKAETAGISVLTNLGAVSGNPDGSFAPARNVNRAEFLKILFKSNPALSVSDSDAATCFPDVKKADWFSSYVCLAKTQNIIAGYPDGLFRPATIVNYAEALKILAESYNETLPQPSPTERWAWYTAYVRAATTDAVALPGNLDPATALTRGQVARLAAAYRAWHDGELAEYRAFERGQIVSSSSSSSSSSVSSLSSSSSSVSSSSISSSSSSSSVASTAVIFPAVSHFLLTGTRTPPAFDGTFLASDEDSLIRFVDVTLRQEVKSISTMTLVDASGKEIATLVPSTDNNTDRLKWRAVLPDSSTYKLLRGVPTVLGVEYNLFDRANGGVSNEFVDGIQSFAITVSGTSTNASHQIVPTDFHYPQHQTTDAKVTAILNTLSGSTALTAGNNKLIGRFAISGNAMTGGILSLTSLEFTLAATNVSVSNIRIGSEFPVQQKDCGIDTVQASHITCSVIPDDFREVSNKAPTPLSIYADVSVNPGSTTGSLQVTFPLGHGKIGQSGALRWEDSTGHYNWVESSVPFENGMTWTVKP